MLMKRKLTLLSLLMLSALLCSAATMQSFRMQAAARKSFPSVEEKYTSYETAAYILKEENGYVAVFSSKDSRLLEMTTIPVSTLRKADCGRYHRTSQWPAADFVYADYKTKSCPVLFTFQGQEFVIGGKIKRTIAAVSTFSHRSITGRRAAP
jgi:hypothetical protein